MGKPEKIRIGELLVQQGLLTQAQLSAALSDQKRTGRKLGRVLIDNGFLSEDQIGAALAQQLQVPFIDLRQFNIPPELAMRLPEALARRFRAIVLQGDSNAYSVGFADPTDLFAYDEIARHLKRDIHLVVVSESLLMQTIDRIYRRTEEISGLAQELGAELGESVIDLGSMGRSPGVEDAPVVKLLQSVFEDATVVSHRRRAACPDIGRLENRACPCAAAKTDVRARYFGKTSAAGRAFQYQGAEQPDRRPYFDNAEPVWRVGGYAFAEPVERHTET